VTYDDFGYLVDQDGVRWGWCTSCGEGAVADTECCGDGQVVPMKEEPEPTSPRRHHEI